MSLKLMAVDRNEGTRYLTALCALVLAFSLCVGVAAQATGLRLSHQNKQFLLRRSQSQRLRSHLSQITPMK